MVVCPNCRASYADNTALKFCGRCGSHMGGEAKSTGEWVREEPAVRAGAGDPWVGRLVDGRYRVLEMVGMGGMGAVYRVQHVRMGKVAAMKVLHRELAGDKEAARRFRREAEAVSALSHPNIVQTFDFGQWESSLYLVMEYVRGEELGSVVRREGPMPFARGAPLFAEIASALAEAHAAGIIHRDLKPENVVLVRRRDGSEHVKVLDFGLAKLRERQDLAEITSRGSLVGTPYYMSPEQVRSEVLDARSDLYSLGATMYRVLTGEPAFQADTPVGVLTKHVTEALQAPSSRRADLDIPPEADEIVMRAMAKERRDRYQTAGEMQAALEGVLAVRRATWDGRLTASDPAAAAADGSGVVASEPERLRREDFDAFERSLRRRRLLAGMAFPALLAALGAGAWWVVGRSGDKAVSSEVEPNNTAGMANLLPNGKHVHGTIGKVMESGEPDRDWWRVPASDRPRQVKARLQGIPGMDLVLELYDAQGRLLAKGNQGGAGDAETLPATDVGAGEAYMVVRELWVQGRTPTVNTADEYSLLVDWN